MWGRHSIKLMLDTNTFDYIYDNGLTNMVRNLVARGKLQLFATDVQEQEIDMIPNDKRKEDLKQTIREIGVKIIGTSAATVAPSQQSKKGFHGSRVDEARAAGANDVELLNMLVKSNIKHVLKNEADLLIFFTALKEDMDYLVTGDTDDFNNPLELFRMKRGTKLQIKDNTDFKRLLYYMIIHKVRDFMFEDIDKTMQLIDTPRGGPNFLLALGLCCYTEYWGKLILGIEKKERGEPSQDPFNEFLYRLDRTYYQKLSNDLENEELDIYVNIRCGLAHAYMIEGAEKATINTGENGHHGIEYDFKKKQYTFWVRAYFEEFKKAVDCYLKGLEEGTENLSKLVNALKKRPHLT